MELILKTSSSNENWNGDCDYVLVDLTQFAARQLLDRIDTFTKSKTVDAEARDHTYWWYYFVCFSTFDYEDEEWDCFANLLEAADYLPAPFGFVVTAEHRRSIECCYIDVDATGCSMHFVPRHTDVRIWAGYLDRPLLSYVALGGQAEDAKKEQHDES